MNLLWSFDLISHIALSIIRNKRSVILHYWQLMNFFFNDFFFLYVICEKNIKLNYWFIIFSGFKEIKKKFNKEEFTMECKYKKIESAYLIFDILNIYINKLIISLTRDVKLYILSIHQDNTLSLCLPSSLKLPVLYIWIVVKRTDW